MYFKKLSLSKYTDGLIVFVPSVNKEETATNSFIERVHCIGNNALPHTDTQAHTRIPTNNRLYNQTK